MLKQLVLVAAWLGFALAASANEEDKAADAMPDKQAAIIEAYEREQAERRMRLAREKQAREAQRARAAYESQCQFKPVMSDEDLARCRTVYRN